MSAKRSRALSRLENHKVSPVRTQNERSGNESQKKSKSAETCSRPRSEDNVPISHHHSKRSRERSPSKKGPDCGAERDLPRRKGPDLVADPPGENVLVRSRVGLGLARIAIPFHRKVGRRRVHVDMHIVIVKLHLSAWARFLVQAQQASDEWLFMLESEVKRSSEEYNVISSKPKHKFNKKIYGD